MIKKGVTLIQTAHKLKLGTVLTHAKVVFTGSVHPVTTFGFSPDRTDKDDVIDTDQKSFIRASVKRAFVQRVGIATGRFTRSKKIAAIGHT